MKRLAVIAFALGGVAVAGAHPADVSYLKVKVEPQRLELRFTFNLLTLTRFSSIDLNGDAAIEVAELRRTERSLHEYLSRQVKIRINDQPANLGTPAPLVCLWPSPRSSHRATELGYGQRYVDLVFAQEVMPRLDDFWISFDIWREAGPLASVEANYEEGDIRTHVPFTLDQSDFSYKAGLGTGTPVAMTGLVGEAARERNSDAVWLIGGGGALVLLAAVLAIWRAQR